MRILRNWYVFLNLCEVEVREFLGIHIFFLIRARLKEGPKEGGEPSLLFIGVVYRTILDPPSFSRKLNKKKLIWNHLAFIRLYLFHLIQYSST